MVSILRRRGYRALGSIRLNSSIKNVKCSVILWLNGASSFLI